ncbi:MAG: glycine cleavage system aminomethyltransferase GcvT [Nitrospiraceae bacterium]
MNRTPLFDGHTVLGAKLVDFAGWEMPIQYSGVVDEYYSVRRASGLFDVSHMGRIAVTGSGALAFLQRVTTNDVATIGVLQSHYSMLCNPEGGIKDDIFIYRTEPDVYLVCVNAGNREKIVAWLATQLTGEDVVELRDRSGEIAQLALQGPASSSILGELNVGGLEALKPRQCLNTTLAGAPSLITRTGYTGEVGYELYIPVESALRIWNELLTRGKAAGLKPVGLGARDLLRLEMAYLLYGNDITEDTTPLEAGADWVVSFKKGPFIGRDALQRQKQEGLGRRLAAFELLEKAVPRHGFSILSTDQPGGEQIGEVTSGNLSPMLQKGIGLCYLPPARTHPGSTIAVDIRQRRVPAIVVKPPFYQRQRQG